MKLLWVNANFLHPTTKGGQIRTLEMLRHLHARHEIHYVAFENPREPEGVRRSGEYAQRAFPIPHRPVDKRSASFAVSLAAGLVSPVPVALGTRRSARMRETIANLLAAERYDRLVCDFLTPSINLPDLAPWVLFQHNVETMIWRRAAEQAPDPLRRAYLRLQAARMFRYEARVCRSVRHVIAVSDADAALMRSLFGAERVSSVPTGVDTDFFAPPGAAPPTADLVFVGSMDWAPNIDGVLWFFQEVLPLLRARRPHCSVAIVGRTPPPEIRRWAGQDARIQVTGTVPDVRPYLWGSRASIVPLRIGGGTRLKIYEAMAARVPVVSTTVGAEGLAGTHPEHIRLADTPETFAAQCLELLDDPAEAARMAGAACRLVSSAFSWNQVSRCFEQILEQAADPACVSNVPR